MNFKLPRLSATRRASVARAALVLAGVAQLWAQDPASSQGQDAQSDVRSGKVSVQLPPSVTQFPGAEGAVIANSQCLMCHSADMVLRQPARTQEQWKETINKMRIAYGAPLPADQVDALAVYLSNLVK